MFWAKFRNFRACATSRIVWKNCIFSFWQKIDLKNRFGAEFRNFKSSPNKTFQPRGSPLGGIVSYIWPAGFCRGKVVISPARPHTLCTDPKSPAKYIFWMEAALMNISLIHVYFILPYIFDLHPNSHYFEKSWLLIYIFRNFVII